jgi:hypothetical protein
MVAMPDPIRRSVVGGLPLVRRLGFGVLAVLAIVSWLTLGPTRAKSINQYEQAIKAANANYEANNVAADRAPQREVVNGWFSRDMQTIMAEQNNDCSGQARTGGFRHCCCSGCSLSACQAPGSLPNPGRSRRLEPHHADRRLGSGHEPRSGVSTSPVFACGGPAGT